MGQIFRLAFKIAMSQVRYPNPTLKFLIDSLLQLLTPTSSWISENSSDGQVVGSVSLVTEAAWTPTAPL